MAQGLLSGVLPAIYSGADQLKMGVYGLLTNPQEQAERAAQSLLQSRADRQALMARTFADPTNPTKVTDQAGLSQLTDQVMSGELGFAPAGITAFHGSPYKFNKFDISKVGTGEGAQAYGHGMYFAESPGVANTYKGSDEVRVLANGQITESPVAKQIIRYGGNPQAYIDSLQNKVNAQKEALQKASKEEVLPGLSNYDLAKIDLDSTLNKIQEANSYKSVKTEPIGNLYKVDIPDEYVPKMLSWDKPLREQPEILKTLGFDVKKYDKLKAQRDAMPEKFDIDIPEELAQYNKAMALEKEMREMPIDFSGKYFYESLIKKYGTQKAISEALSEKGIKGIQYLDAGSRGKAAERSSNFVVFDPTDVKILERNNEPFEGLLGN